MPLLLDTLACVAPLLGNELQLRERTILSSFDLPFVESGTPRLARRTTCTSQAAVPVLLHRACGHVSLDSESQKVQHYLDTISHRFGYRELMLDGPPENSSDSERAPGARSITDEFSGGPSSVNKLLRCENTGFHLHAAPFGTRSLLHALLALLAPSSSLRSKSYDPVVGEFELLYELVCLPLV